MNKTNLDQAITECNRFLVKCLALKASGEYASSHEYIFGCKESGAARRSSLDLTRALAELRNPK